MRGRLVVVGGAEGKVEQAYRDRLDLLVMPSSNLRRLKTDGWSQELKAYAAESVKGADNFIELLELTVQGEDDRTNCMKRVGCSTGAKGKVNAGQILSPASTPAVGGRCVSRVQS